MTLTNQPILVTGATGKTGSRVAERLSAHGLTVRSGSRAGRPPFDWDNPQTWEAAVKGACAAYIAYQPDLAFPGAAETLRAFANLAVAQGVRRLVLLSGRNEEGAMKSEEAIQHSGAQWTIIRASFFFQNFSENDGFVAQLQAGEVAFPGGAVKEPFIDADDIADIAAAALTEERHVGQLYEVTGPRLLTFGEALGAIARETSREIRYVAVSPKEYSSMMIEQGVPADFAEQLAHLFATVLDGRNAFVTDGVERALGRKPTGFDAFVRKTAQSGVWDSAS